VSKENLEARKILVGNLPTGATETELAKLFSAHAGRVVSVLIGVDPRGRQQGHATVEMGSRQEALEAVKELSGMEMLGRTLNLSILEQSDDDSKKKKRGFFGMFGK
jgi:RNA recognition motif-containing protein